MTCLTSINECNDFILLMGCGLDIESLIHVVFKQETLIIEALKNGQTLIDVLCKNQKKLFFKFLYPIGQKVNLKDAHDCVCSIEKNTTALIRHLLKKIAYPFFLMVFAFFMILFFTDYVLIQMQAYVLNMNIFIWLRILKLLFIIIILSIILYLACLYIFLYRYKKMNPFFFVMQNTVLFKKMSTLQFVVIFSCLEKTGLSTMDTLHCMCEFSFSIVKDMAREILNRLKEGKSFETCIMELSLLDKDLKKMMRYALRSNKLHLFMGVYEKKCTIELHAIIKKFSIVIQIFSYITIGILVLVVYQIMLMPMNMLNQF